MSDGAQLDLFTLKDGDFEARIATYGGTVVSLRAPDRRGCARDVVLGFDRLDGYVANSNGPSPAFFGAIIGRYANRIAHGKFALGGRTYLLPLNNGQHSIHGGPGGFHNVVWKSRAIAGGVELTYLSKHGEEGYPGNLSVCVRYTLTGGNFRIEYSAGADRDTILNLTNHCYLNLSGRDDVREHQLTLRASRFTPVDSSLIPTGELKPVDSTPFDFRKACAIGARIDADDEQLRFGHGYDHNWVLDKPSGALVEAAELYDPASGRLIHVLTDQPGIQFYSGNFLDGSLGKEGVKYGPRSGLCLETQHFPDSPNHPNFPLTELKAGETFHSATVYSFSAR
jgi:aldose 1-epimerase